MIKRTKSSQFFPAELPSLVRARWRWVAAVTVVVMAGALVAGKMEHRSYSSSVSVVIGSQQFASGAEPLPPDLGTAKVVATSNVVLDPAAAKLGVTVDDLRGGLAVTNPADTSVLVFAYSAPDAREAQERAQTVAKAFASFQNAELQAVANQQKIVAAGGHSHDATLSAEPVTIISPAQLPKTPSGHTLVLDLLVALIAGLGLGLGVALLVDRYSRRLQGPAEIRHLLDAPVLAEIPPASRSSSGRDPVLVVTQDEQLAAAYRSLRVRLQDASRTAAVAGASVQAGDREPAAVRVAASAPPSEAVLVIPPNRLARAPLPPALGLAVSIALSGRRVILLGADLRARAIGRTFRVADAPGFAEMLRGDARPADVLLDTSVAGLQVIPEGAHTSGAEDMIEQARLSVLLAELARSGCDSVVIDGLPLLESPESLTLVAAAGQVLLAVDPRRVGRPELRQAAASLAEHSGKLLGVVLTHPARGWTPERRFRHGGGAAPAGPYALVPGEGGTPAAASSDVERAIPEWLEDVRSASQV